MKESQHTEWKRAWRDDYLRWVCGFANAGGGTLVICRDDDGKVVGLANAKRLMEELPNKVRDLLGIIVKVNLRRTGELEYIEIVTEAHPSPISYRGHYYQRSGSTLQELKGAALDRFLLSRQGRSWDGVPVPAASPRSLAKSAVDAFRRMAAAGERMDAADLKGASATLMERLHLWDGRHLKRAAILAFHPDPERFVTGAFVKLGFFATDDDLRYQDEIHRPLIGQVERIVDVLHKKYLKAAISYAGLQRVETYPVPDAALREAALNAIVHKNYTAGDPVQISVYSDRLMIWNPGQLPAAWTVQTLKQKHASHAFNPDLANVFFRAGQIEAWGRGIEKMRAACRAAGCPEPSISYKETGLWVTFAFSDAYQKLVHADQSASRGELAAEVTAEVTAEVERLIRVLRGAMSRKDIQARLGLHHAENFRLTYLAPALDAGLIEMTVPDKPTSRLQKYRLTAKGRKIGAAMSHADGAD